MSTQGSSQGELTDWFFKSRFIVEHAWNVFAEIGRWPDIRELQRWMAQHAIRSPDPAHQTWETAEEAARAIPALPGELRPFVPDAYVLRLRHLQFLSQADDVVAACVAAAQVAVDQYLTINAPLTVSANHPSIIGKVRGQLQSEKLTIVGNLLLSETASPFAGGGPLNSPNWELTINDGTIRAYAEHPMETLADFLKAQRSIMERSSRNVPLAGHIRNNPVDVPAKESPGPDESFVFVIMPFGADWSDIVFETIKTCFAEMELDGLPRLVRADEIEEPGHINEQIVTALRNCTFAVAEISDLNPNVMWEVGFAHALDKRVILLAQNGMSAPFDIYDHRQIRYDIQTMKADVGIHLFRQVSNVLRRP